MSNGTRIWISLAICFPLAQAQERLPVGPGRDTLKKVCSPCHSAENVVGLAKTREEWGAVVGDMLARGAKGTDDEFNDVVDYLAEHFPQAPPVNVNKASAKDLETSLGFSPKEAEAIVHYRGEKGNFKSVEEVEKVPGVDAKKVQARRDRLAF
ncbi:MAG TPA: helix-hairpin-helix domain-containing protein [Bryobacteraceae bacterium]|nr:helix-hairpin-helix domain-containing protein [Bryobacteraceae bacterium]